MDHINDIRRGAVPVRFRKRVGQDARLQAFTPIDVNSKGNYLRCRTWDGVNEGTEIIAVARPRELQQDVYDGHLLDGFAYDYDGPNFRIVTRESDGKDEQQVIVPAYKAMGDVRQIIYAMRAWTGVVEEDDVGPIDDAHVLWLDINVAGRAWTKKKPTTA